MDNKNLYGISLIQVSAGFVILPVMYFFFDPANGLLEETGFIYMIDVVIFPLAFTLITIMLCLIAGIPFQYIPVIRKWWLSKPVLQISLFTIGVIILFLSLFEAFRITREYVRGDAFVIKFVANEWLSLPGWFLTAFCIININPSVILEYFQKKLNRKAYNSY